MLIPNLAQTAAMPYLQLQVLDATRAARVQDQTLGLGSAYYGATPLSLRAEVAHVVMPALLGPDTLEQWQLPSAATLIKRARFEQIYYSVAEIQGERFLQAHLQLPEPDSLRPPISSSSSSMDGSSIDDPSSGSSLKQATEDAYRQLFALMQKEGITQPLRFWNYVPRINDEEAGLERYRQFNLGRHAAIEAAINLGWWSATTAPPAACALGTAAGTALTIMALASTRAAIALDNPRQVAAYRYPSRYGPRPPDFSRASLYCSASRNPQALLLVSGTASIVGHQTLHVGNAQAQLAESLRNINAVLDEANRVLSEQRINARFALPMMQLRAYLRHAQDATLIAPALLQASGGRAVPIVQADICRHDLLLEVEATGIAVASV